MTGSTPGSPRERIVRHTDELGRTYAVHVAGNGPPVVIIHELAGISPMLLEFARRVRERGFTTHLPELIPRRSGPTRVLLAAVQVCISAEFTTLARGKTSPIVAWLRSYAASVHADTGADIGVVGMCLTGGFALAMAVDEFVVAPVVAHPSLPFGLGSARQADLGLSPSDRAAVEGRSDLVVKGVRFSCDVVAPSKRFDRLAEMFGERFIRTDIPSGRGTPFGFSRWEHSVLNNARIQPTNPTHNAARAELDRVVDDVLGFLDTHLRRPTSTDLSATPSADSQRRNR